MDLRLSKKSIWPLGPSTQKAFDLIIGWRFKSSAMLGPRVQFIVTDALMTKFTPSIHNRFLRVFRDYYKQPVTLEYDTLESIEQRAQAKKRRDAKAKDLDLTKI